MTHVHNYIGGGNIAAILGISPFSTPLQEFMKITGQAPDLTAAQLEFFEGRKDLEPFVRNKLRRKYKAELVAQNERYTDSEFPWMRAEIDAEEADSNYEIKTASQWAARQWGETETDDYPPYVAAQAMWGLMIRPKKVAYVAPCIGFDEIRRYRMVPDHDLIALLRSRAIRFWNEHVVPNVPPPPMNLDDVSLLWPKSAVKKVMATPVVLDHVLKLAELKQKEKKDGETADFHALQIKTAFADADTMVREDGAVVATWKSPKDSMKFDADGYAGYLEETMAKRGVVLDRTFSELRNDFTHPKPNARRLLLK